MKKEKALAFFRQLGVEHVMVRTDVNWNFFPEVHPNIGVRDESMESTCFAHTKQPFACLGETIKMLQELPENQYIVVGTATSSPMEFRWSKKFKCFMLRSSPEEVFK